MVIYKEFFAFYGEVRAKACEYRSFGFIVSFFKPNVGVAGKIKGSLCEVNPLEDLLVGDF